VEVLETGRDWWGTSHGRGGVEIELELAGQGAGGAGAPSPGGDGPVAAELSGRRLRCWSPLAGRVQMENLAVAAATAARLGIPDRAIVAGAAAVRWPGRLQWVDGSPPVLLDGAHNPAALAALAPQVAELAEGRRVVAVFGAMVDKQLEEMLPLLSRVTAEVVLTSVGGGRAASAAALATILGRGIAVEPVAAALAEARRLAGPSGLVLVCGSLALVGAVLAQMGIG
jgi:dihydrofolate synthase/folylpolyglutamate synthase